MDSGSPSKGKDGKEFTVKFKVFEHSDRSKGHSVLKLAKPYVEPGGSGIQDCPEVSIIRQSATNKHAVEIMSGMRHQNIISMKAVGPELQDDILIFIEKVDGNMGSILPNMVSEMGARIPSDKFRRIMIEVIEGVEFLRKKGTYHGDLNWMTTLYKGNFTVKLSGFRYHDSMDMEDAQWQDWMSLRQMLQDVSDIAVQINQDPQREVKLACDDVNAVIELIGRACADRTSLHQMKHIVLEDVFFWTPDRRTMFMMSTVSTLIRVSKFREALEESNICELPWDSNDTNRKLSRRPYAEFSALLNHCIEYRKGIVPMPPPLDPNKISGCVSFACAAYSHKNQEDIMKICQGHVDFLFRMKYPKMFIELWRIIKEWTANATH